MKSIRSIYKIGLGPSSSHTMGPAYAATRFLQEHPQADFIRAILYGSLAKTGEGHGTNRAIAGIFAKVDHEILFDCETPTPVHPNTVTFIAFKDGCEVARQNF